MRGLLAATLALLLVEGAAGAQSALVASYAGRSGAELAPYLKPVADSITPSPRWGAQLGKDLIHAFGPSPGVLESDRLADMKDTADKIESGLLLGEVSPDAAIRSLEEERRRLVDKPGSLAVERDLYAQILKTLVRAYQLRGKATNASARMTEYALAFVDRPLTAETNVAPPVLHVYEQVQLALQRDPHGSLRVDKGNAGGKVIINGMPAPQRPLPLPQGEYTVFVSTVSGDTRVHQVPVRREDLIIPIDVAFEVALSTEGVVGLRFDSSETLEHAERRYVEKIGRALGLTDVYVVSQVTSDGQPALRLRAYSMRTGQLADSVAVLGGVVGPAQVAEMAKRLTQKIAGRAPALVAPKPAPSFASAAPQAGPATSHNAETQKHRNDAPARPAPATPPKPVPPAPAAVQPKAAPPAPETERERARREHYATLSRVDQLDEDARDAYVTGQYRRAQEIARQELKVANDEGDVHRALRVLAASACFLHDRTTLDEVWKRLTENDRGFVRYVCQRNVMETPK